MTTQAPPNLLTVLVSARLRADWLSIYGTFRAKSLAAHADLLQDLAAKEPLYVNTGLGGTIQICYETRVTKTNRHLLDRPFVESAQFEMNNLLNFLESFEFAHVPFDNVTPSRLYGRFYHAQSFGFGGEHEYTALMRYSK